MGVKDLSKKQIGMIGLTIGLLVCFIAVVAVRLEYPPEKTHYHANFGVFIDGKRDNFESFAFFEEVQACVGDQENNPKHRVHMHDKVNHVTHVHEKGATWGHFFANLGYGLSDEAIATDEGVFVDSENGKKLSFVLNGKEVSTIANEVINSEDALLISYGKDEILSEQFNQITKDAAEYNQRNDPSACTGTQPTTWQEKLSQAVKFWE